jgi:hypothetical protein
MTGLPAARPPRPDWHDGEEDEEGQQGCAYLRPARCPGPPAEGGARPEAERATDQLAAIDEPPGPERHDRADEEECEKTSPRLRPADDSGSPAEIHRISPQTERSTVSRPPGPGVNTWRHGLASFGVGTIVLQERDQALSARYARTCRAFEPGSGLARRAGRRSPANPAESLLCRSAAGRGARNPAVYAGSPDRLR